VSRLDERGKLLVRDSLCCCAACLDRNWAGCELKEYVPPPRPIMLGIDVDTAGAGDKSNQNLEVSTEQEGQAEMFFELGETYAVRSEESNMGFFLFRLMSKSGEVLCGEMLTEKKSEKGRHGYVHYEASGSKIEVVTDDIICSVELDNHLKAVKRVLEDVVLCLADV